MKKNLCHICKPTVTEIQLKQMFISRKWKSNIYLLFNYKKCSSCLPFDSCMDTSDCR